MIGIYQDSFIEFLKNNLNNKVKITNKSEYPIVLANNKEEFEIGIYIGDQTRAANLPIANVILEPNSSQTRNLEFTKFASKRINKINNKIKNDFNLFVFLQSSMR